MKLSQALAQAISELRETSDTAELDAEILLAHELQVNRSYLYTWPEKELSDDVYFAFEDLVKARLSGRPIAYLLGNKSFWDLDLMVSDATLIPRPDTEILVAAVLDHVKEHKQLTVLDLGTGSGAIALALAYECPHWDITAVEQSAKAMVIAKQNIIQLQLPHVELLQGDWYEPVSERRFDIIVSNPPYIAEEDEHLKRGDVRFEPRDALVSGKDGLDAIRHIIRHASEHLNSQGSVFLEHGYDQAEAVRTLLSDAGFSDVQTKPDLSGNDRVSWGRFSG